MSTPFLSREPAVALASGNWPLAFVPNAGQVDSTVRFQAHSPAGLLFFTASEVVLALPAPAEPLDPDDPLAEPQPPPPPSVLRLGFQGAQSSPVVAGEERLPGTVNYFLGDDPAGWQTNLPTYAGIVYEQLYPGIDLHFEGGSGPGS